MSLATQPSKPILQAVREAMTEYYTLLCRMPHMRPDCLRIPPAEGWFGSHSEDLKEQGWSEEAAEFVRHVPYLSPGIDAEHAWITSTSTAIAFDQLLGKNLPRTSPDDWPSPPSLPPHVIYIGQGHFEGSSYLLLDTELGQIVCYGNYGQRHLLPHDDHDSLPLDQRWMAHPTLPAEIFFEQESMRLKRLVYMPVPTRYGPKFYYRAESRQAEEELLAVEDEYEADHEHDSDYDDNESEDGDTLNLEDLTLSSDDDATEDEEADDSVSQAEIEWLRDDAGHGEYQPSASLRRWGAKPLPEETMKVYEIYKRNGWPHEHFDVQTCRVELNANQDAVDQQRKNVSDGVHRTKREEYLKRLSPQQLERIEENKRLAKDMQA